MAEQNSKDFEDLLSYLRTARGFDFSSYKRATLMRRIEKRMQAVNVDSYAAYLDYLQVDQDEFAQLFNTILINVTGFFRDPDAWEYLRDNVVPLILERRSGEEEIRIWSAGCASGEEAYTLAAIFADAMGVDTFKKRVKIYATDLDEEALQQSRQAVYAARDLEAVDPELLKRYFEPLDGGRYAFDRELRRSVIFGKHDLVADAPVSRVDLLVCRNTLMYFNSEIQEKVLGRFHFALNEGGFLFLGKAETMITHGNIFAPLEMKRRVFVKNGHGHRRERILSSPTRATGHASGDEAMRLRLRELALDASPVAQILIDAAGTIAFINASARARFGMSSRDIGRPIQDLEISYRPLELRSVIEQVHAQRRPMTIKDVAWTGAGAEPALFDIHVSPIVHGTTRSTSITFTEVTEFKRLQEELQHFNQELETAYEELQSTVEELETTNEELHSTNEELETSNEALQTTNEELEVINQELQQVGADLFRAKAFLNSVLSSIRAGVLVVDDDMRVIAWNEQSQEMWGVNAEEVRGRHVWNLDIGFPVETLRTPVRTVLLDGKKPVEYEAECVNRRGKPIQCRVTCSKLQGEEGQPLGVIVAVEEIES